MCHEAGEAVDVYGWEWKVLLVGKTVEEKVEQLSLIYKGRR